MPQPLYFDADPTIPDADMLGYGDLIFDDGSKRFLNGEPEIAASLPPLPQNDTSMGPPEPSPDQNYGQPMGDQNPTPGVHVDPMTGNITPDTSLPPGAITVGKVQPTTSKVGTAPQMDLSQAEPGAANAFSDQLKTLDKYKPGSDEAAKAASAAAGLPPGVVVKPDGTVEHNGQSAAPQSSGAPSTGYGSGGLIPAQREGALPPAVAQQQSAAMGVEQQQTLRTLQASREAESKVYHDAFHARMGTLDAEKQAQTEQLQEQNAKQDRLRQEQDTLAKTDIKTDLVSAQGGLGAVLSIIGAALLGKVGSDAGLRMIQQSINTNIEKQKGQRDSQLHILADRLGDMQQATAGIKAQLLKNAADRAEQMQQLTKADAFDAQTPEIIQSVRAEQLKATQDFVDKSLGKTIEKAPAAAKPANWRAVEGYGKAEKDQVVSDEAVDRAAAAIGKGSGVAPIFDKQGNITNKKEILDAGIPGVSVLQSQWQGGWLAGLNRMTVSEPGRQIQAALKTLVQATAKDQNGNRVTDADVPRAAETMGMDSEAGTLDAIERLYKVRLERHEQNVAEFGTDAAAQYQGTYQGMGGKNPLAPRSEPGALQIAQPGQARQMVEQSRAPKGSGNSAEDSLRQQGLMPDQQSQRPQTQNQETPVDPKERMAQVAADVQTIAGKELPPEGLKILVAQAGHESGDGHGGPDNNFFGHKAGKTGGKEYETTEGAGADAKKVRARFATYDTPAAAVQDQVRLLKSRYPNAWVALTEGDVDAFAAALKDGGYYTADETQYVNALKRRL